MIYISIPTTNINMTKYFKGFYFFVISEVKFTRSVCGIIKKQNK